MESKTITINDCQLNIYNFEFYLVILKYLENTTTLENLEYISMNISNELNSILTEYLFIQDKNWKLFFKIEKIISTFLENDSLDSMQIYGVVEAYVNDKFIAMLVSNKSVISPIPNYKLYLNIVLAKYISICNIMNVEKVIKINDDDRNMYYKYGDKLAKIMSIVKAND